MAQITRKTRIVDPNPHTLPDWLVPAGVILDQLAQGGLLAGAADRLQVRRSGGYAGYCGLMVLLAMFSSAPRCGIRKFYERAREFWPHLAALCGQRRLPTPASISRMLSAAEYEPVRRFSRWLLVHALDLRQLLGHASVKHFDGLGQDWHLFHFDPTEAYLRGELSILASSRGAAMLESSSTRRSTRSSMSAT